MVVVGLVLVVGAIACFIAEANLPSGLFGATGTVALLVGGFLLVQDARGVQISVGILLALVILVAVSSVYVGYVAIQARDAPPAIGAAGSIVGAVGVVRDAVGTTGHAHVDGARWRIVSSTPLQPGMQIRVVAVDGLTATVQPTDVRAETQLG